MNYELEFLAKRMCDPRISATSIIPWSSPVPSFGDLYSSVIATVGLNPSNKEFVDSTFKELIGPRRRFPTLNSLNIASWSDIKESDIAKIHDSCKNYFDRNPYQWFKRLDFIISGTTHSYYFPTKGACHLDLIPFATSEKWGNLTVREKSLLLELSGDILGALLRASSVTILVLNGGTVVDNFKRISNVTFDSKEQVNWNLPRGLGNDVVGFSYEGRASNVGGIDLGREIQVIGYNHNIQSSFGVTSEVLRSIRNWISNKALI